MKLDDTSAV